MPIAKSATKRQSSLGQQGARALQVFRRIDAEGCAVDRGDGDGHAVFQGAQLLQPFALFERGRRQGDETLQRHRTVAAGAKVAHGVDVERSRLGLVLFAVALVAIVTAATGPIAFVALAAPQVARRLAGSAGIPIAGSAFIGALLLLSADLIAQHTLPVDVPVGIVTVVLGGIYLLTLLIQEARRRT